MAAFALFVLAVAGIAVFHHTVSGYPEGWLLAITAGLASVVALLLVASAMVACGPGRASSARPSR